MEQPRTIHDFGGFPRALYQAEYLAPGSQWLAQQTTNAVKKVEELEATFRLLAEQLPYGAEPATILSESAVLGE